MRKVVIPKGCKFCGGKVKVVTRGRVNGSVKILKVIAVIVGVVVAIAAGYAEIKLAGVIHYYLVPLIGVMVGGVIWGIAEAKPKYMDYRCLSCKKVFSVQY